jgi:hypothetical protein
MSYESFGKPRRRADMPEVPKADGGEKPIRKTVKGEDDGRSLRRTDRKRQFNPRVTEKCLEAFDEVQAYLEGTEGRKVTQAYVMEVVVADFKRSKGHHVNPFGLSAEAMKAAERIAEHNGWELSEALEDALSARLQHFGLLGRVLPLR